MAGPRLTGRHHIARLPVEDALACGFVLLPTFTAPHYTVVMGPGGTATLDAFAELASRDVIVNPYYRGVRG